jgi:hypothetical protein
MVELTKSDLGILALWNDCEPGNEERYEHWYQTEHLVERLGVPGFLSGRRYESLQGSPRFFTYYETTSPDVLTSEAYLERVNNPTPQTREIMSGIFTNMSRTICRKAGRLGRIHGACVLTVRFKTVYSEEQLAQVIERVAREVFVTGLETWHSYEKKEQQVSNEEQLRGRDEKIAACLLVETLRESDLQPLSEKLRQAFGQTATINAYRLLCSLLSEEQTPALANN